MVFLEPPIFYFSNLTHFSSQTIIHAIPPLTIQRGALLRPSLSVAPNSAILRRFSWMLMLHLRGAHCYHSSPSLLGITQRLRMASTVSYTRKRRKGAVAESSIVCVKHEFDEFRHVKKEPEQSSQKKEEAHPLDPVEISNGSGADNKPAIRANAAPDQVTLRSSIHSSEQTK